MWIELASYWPVIADWASVVSLFVSGYAAYTISKVRSDIVARIRLPNLVAALELHGKNFSNLMLTFDEPSTRDQFVVELARCEANLRLIKSRVGRSPRRRASKVLERIARYKSSRWFGYYPASSSRDDAWGIYSELNGLLEELKNLVEEQKLGG